MMVRLKKSFGFALNGIRQCFISETNFKIHTAFAVLVIAAGLLLHISSFNWIILVICMAFVFAAELINTAIEKLCDMVHVAQHPQIKLIKDMSAAAVLIISIAAAITGLIVFIPKIYSLF